MREKMKTIKIRVPNKSSSKEWEVLDAVERLLNKMERSSDISIHQGQGGDLDDWKEPDLSGEKDGLLMVFRVSLKGKEAEKEANRYYKKAIREHHNIAKAEMIGVASGLPLLMAKMYLDKAKNLLKQA